MKPPDFPKHLRALEQKAGCASLSLPNVHHQLMAATLMMTQCRLQALLALVRFPCSEPPPASLFLTWLCTEMFFSLSALGRDWSCYPSQSMSVNFLVPRGLSTSASAWEVALSLCQLGCTAPAQALLHGKDCSG